MNYQYQILDFKFQILELNPQISHKIDKYKSIYF